jgi:hypothetical protein
LAWSFRRRAALLRCRLNQLFNALRWQVETFHLLTAHGYNITSRSGARSVEPSIAFARLDVQWRPLVFAPV